VDCDGLGLKLSLGNKRPRQLPEQLTRSMDGRSVLASALVFSTRFGTQAWQLDALMYQNCVVGGFNAKGAVVEIVAVKKHFN